MNRRVIAFTAALAAAMLLTTTLLAQTSTTGSLSGVVRDERGEGLAGVTIVATDQRTGTQYSEITDENGAYALRSLIPGDYKVSLFYADITKVINNVNVRLGKQQPLFTRIDTSKAGGEVIEVEGKAPAIDLGSTKQGISITDDYTRNIPVPGRTYASTLGAAAGSQGDLYGISFSGSSSLENNYVVDGINTTGLNFGTVGTFLVNEFIQETEIITGGYNAEFGRATGGVVNVVTKTGTNEFRGSVFAYLQPGALTAGFERPPQQGTSIDLDSNLAFDTDFGFELGGPIVKDKAWFYIGFAPRLVRTSNERIIQRQTDCRMELPGGGLSACDPEQFQDGTADRDPDTGFFIYDEIARENADTSITTFQFLSKINFAVTPEHQGQVTVSGTPLIGSLLGAGGRGEVSARDLDANDLTTDVSAKWSSKLNNNKTELETQVGWHRVTTEVNSSVDAANALAREDVIFGDLGVLGQGRESSDVVTACADGTSGDPFQLIDNCPDLSGFGYSTGGPGTVVDDLEQRFVWKGTAAHRIKAAGQHLLKVGADMELNQTEVPRQFSGGVFYQNLVDRDQINAVRFAVLGPEGQNICDQVQDDFGNTVDVPCDFVEGARPVTGETLNWSFFAQDSWDILPNLTVNAGIRYEEQRLRYSKELQNTTDPVTGDELGTNALVLRNNWAPRAGVIWDWTKEGRSKVYGSWGRFYQNVPMRINERSFGGETTVTQRFNASQCGDSDIENIGGRSGNGCDPMDTPQNGTDLFGVGVIIAPGVRAQFLDEFTVGTEYEVFEDLVVGISYQDRRLGRVIEDVSVDGAATYIIANPGEVDQGRLDDLQAQIDALPMDDPARARLQGQLDQFRLVGTSFDEAQRNYQAIQLKVEKRFSRNLFLQGSYTWSRTRGNFPGLFSPDTGQLDPNITSQFDLIELLANRDGVLPQDRPHLFNLDAFYQYELPDTWGALGGGVRARVGSGTPIDSLGRHFLYGRREAYLLPRGAFGRTEFQHRVDLRAQYTKPLDKGRYELSAFIDFFNVVNNQGEILVDEEYTVDESNPIVGGEEEDLVFLKRTQPNGEESADPVVRKLNFGNTTTIAAPFAMRFGLRFTF